MSRGMVLVCGSLVAVCAPAPGVVPVVSAAALTAAVMCVAVAVVAPKCCGEKVVRLKLKGKLQNRMVSRKFSNAVIQ